MNEAEKDTDVMDGTWQHAGERARAFCTAETTQESEAGETNTQERQKGQDWKKNALTYVLAGLK